MTEWIKSHSKPTLEQMLRTPFYVVSDTENTLIWHSANGVKINWSLNEDLTDYHELPADTTTEVSMPAGKKVYLFCTEDNPTFFYPEEQDLCKISTKDDVRFSVGGNVCFLTDASCHKKTDFQPKCRNSHQFFELLMGSNVVDASNMIIGFSQLSYDCCHAMFHNCESLVAAPILPSMVLANDCYYNMFMNCTSLVNAPSLPATTLNSECYCGMFSECTSLVTAPVLPATTLGNECYSYMFEYSTTVTDLHFPKSLENDATFLAMYGAPNFGATNATVHYDL